MDVLAIPRTAVDTSLRVLRLPLDTTMAVFDREGGRRSAVALVLDNADAAVRGFAGRVLHDERLREDGRARSIAVDERRRALHLRAEADSRREEADQELRGDLERAEAQRVSARARAEKDQTQVEEAQQHRHRQVIEQTEQRKAANRKATARTEEAIDERAKKARLEQLDEESDVLAAEETAITAASEAQRLHVAASATKHKRKSN